MKRKLSLILTLVLMLSTLVTVSVSAASWPSLGAYSYCEFIAPKTINVYTSMYLNTRGTSSPSKKYNAYIDKGDSCRIFRIDSKYIHLAYPTSSGYKQGFIKRSDLFNVSSPSDNFKSKSSVTTYKYAGSSSYGSTAKNDAIYKVGTSGNYTQIIYTAKSGSRAYKAGWVSNSDYNKIKGTTTSNSTTKQTSSSSSSWQYPMNSAYCTWSTKTDMSWSGYNNRGNSRTDHLGIDIYGTGGTVYAAASGKVVACSSSNSGANGRYIIIQHTINGKTVYSFYAHLSSLNVSKGNNVSKGSKIGVAGGSGYNKNDYYGTHLHFAIVDTLWSGGGYYGYSTSFSGNKKYYEGVTYYNPVYVINNNKLP